MTTTRTRADILADIEDAIRTTMYTDYRDGANDHAYVRVATDGSVYTGREASYCVGEDEYYGRRPHTITVWSASGLRESAGRDDGVFIWEEIEEPRPWVEIDNGEIWLGASVDEMVEEIEGAFCRDGKLYRLSDELIDTIDLSQIMPEIDASLDEFDWIPTAQRSPLPHRLTTLEQR